MAGDASVAFVPDGIAAAGDGARLAWEEFLADHTIAPNTRTGYGHTGTQFLRWLETRGTPLSQVTSAVVADFLNRPGVKTNTQSTYHAALRRFFARLVAHEILPANPFGEVGSRRVAKQPPKPPMLAELTGYVHELALDPVEEGTEEFNAALVLLAGLYFGTKKIMPLSRFTGVHPRRVAEFAERLRASGVWTPAGKSASQWDDEDEGQLAFWLDCLVAEGLLERVPADATEPAASHALALANSS